jgi:hypothetical protein
MQRCISRVLRKSHPLARPIHPSNARSVWSIKQLTQGAEPKKEGEKLRYQRRVEDLPKVLLGNDGKPRAPLPPFNSKGGEPGMLDDDARG